MVLSHKTALIWSAIKEKVYKIKSTQFENKNLCDYKLLI
jgi:hypothetical protein